jgi:hypothetical protein
MCIRRRSPTCHGPNWAARNIHSLITFYFIVRFARSFLPLLEEIILICLIYHNDFCFENCRACARLKLTARQTAELSLARSLASSIHSLITLYVLVRFARGFHPLLEEIFVICLTYYIEFCYKNCRTCARLKLTARHTAELSLAFGKQYSLV